MIRVLITFLLVFLSLKCNSQNEFFSELSIEKEFLYNEGKHFNLDVNYKHAYQDSKWRKLGFTISTQKKLNDHWSIVSGIVNNYRFDKDLGDFFEVRPKLGLQLKTPIIKSLSFSQRVLVEWRNFFISKHNHYLRSRYKVLLNYIFPNNNEDNAWSLSSAFEWYYLKAPDVRERFSNSREFSFFLSKKIQEVHYSLGYIREVFLFRSSNFGRVGNSISLKISF